MARLAAYCLLSIAAAIGVVYYAWQTRIQFYPAVIFLVTSKFSIMVSRLSPPVTFSPIASTPSTRPSATNKDCRGRSLRTCSTRYCVPVIPRKPHRSLAVSLVRA